MFSPTRGHCFLPRSTTEIPPYRSMASSSSSPGLKRYDVFLNYRGEDTRTNFIIYLLKALDDKGIVTFKDIVMEADLTISDVLRLSRIALVVVSENYASSRWCLNELRMIMELQRDEELKVVPIFYGVDPSDVRYQKGSFGEGFEKLQSHETTEDVQKWREALTQIGEISGMISSLWRTDATMIEKLVELVSDELSPPSTENNFPTLFGMDRHMKAIHELLDSESKNNFHMVGIWGTEGVGKTTLARYVYDEISRNFHVHVFLENLKAIDQTHGLLHSVEKFLFRDIRKMGNANVDIKPRLWYRKVLLVVDGVEETKELEDIADAASNFGPGSVVIVTTQDKSLLTECGITHVYEVECLNYDEALELFCQVAFKQEYPPSSFEQLSLHAIYLTGCLPLALKILGSFLYGKGKKDWRSALQRLEESQGKGSKGTAETLGQSYSRADEKYFSSFILPSK